MHSMVERGIRFACKPPAWTRSGDLPPSSRRLERCQMAGKEREKQEKQARKVLKTGCPINYKATAIISSICLLSIVYVYLPTP
jgi:hypothetical protein